MLRTDTLCTHGVISMGDPRRSPSLNEIYYSLVDKGFFGSKREPREFISEALKHVEKAISTGKITIVRAPPGIGKTAISIVASIYALLNFGESEFLQAIHVVPTRSLVEDIYVRVKEGLQRIGIEFGSFISRQYGLVHEAPFLTGAFIVSTLDTYFYNILKIPLAEISKVKSGTSLGHYEVPRASIFSSLNFLDEIHMLLEESNGSRKGDKNNASILISLIRALALCRTPIVLSTATLPDVIINYLARELPVEIEKVDYNVIKRDNFLDREISKHFSTIDFNNIKKGIIEADKPELSIPKVVEKILDGDFEVKRGTTAIVVNTVRSAKEILRGLRSRNINAILLHSRFTPKDREEKLKYIKMTSKVVVVATQVIEVGVDIGFDVLISELSTPSSMIQRFGRLARGDKNEGWWLIYYTRNTIENGSGVYDPNLVLKAKEYLDKVNGRIHWHLPVVNSCGVNGYLEFINNCWNSYRYNPGRDLDIENIITVPSISSSQVLNYIDEVGEILRDENLCTIYLMQNDEIPDDIESFIEKQYESVVTLGCNKLAEVLSKALKQGYPAKILLREYGDGFRRGKLISKSVSKDDVRILKKMSNLLKNFIAIILPSDLYEGGVFGEGLKEL